MRNFKKAALFLLVNLVAAILCRGLFYTPSELTQLLNEYEAGTYNSVVLGQSHAEAAINPYLLSNAYEEVFNFARSFMTQKKMYSFLQQLNQEGQIRYVYLELDSSAWNMTEDNGNPRVPTGGDTGDIFRSVFRGGTHPDWKFLADAAGALPFDDLLFDYYFVPFNSYQKICSVLTNQYPQYRKRISTIEEGTEIGLYAYGGRGFLRGQGFHEMDPANYGFDEGKVTEERLAYFEKLVFYCRTHEIQLRCFTAALNPHRILNENQDAAHAYFSELCSRYGVPYYDFNYIKAEYLPRDDGEYLDREGHMNGDLADRQTRLLRNVLDSPNSNAYFETSYDAVKARVNAQ